MRRLTPILCVLFLVGLMPWPVNGRVFRATGIPGGRLNTVGLPWEFAYHTTMNVNGRRNAVYVYSARFHEPVAEQLRSQFERQGAKVVLSQTADGAVGVATWTDHEARMLILSPESQPNQMVFLFYPEGGNVRAPRFPIPEYPGGKMGNTVSNEQTDTRCATLETTDSAEQVHAFYAAALVGDGWTPTLPQSRTFGVSSKMAIYHKREMICCILAKKGPGGLNRVTVLVKGGGL